MNACGPTKQRLGSPGKLPGRGTRGAQLGRLETEQCLKERGSGGEVEPRKRGCCKMNRSCWSNMVWKKEGRRYSLLGTENAPLCDFLALFHRAPDT